MSASLGLILCLSVSIGVAENRVNEHSAVDNPRPAAGIYSLEEAFERSDSAQVIVILETESVSPAMLARGLRANEPTPFAAQQANVSARMATLGLKVKRQFRTLPALVTEVSRDSIRALRAMPGVKDVVVDEAYPPTLNGTIPIIKADTQHALGIDGSGYAVAILDTGVDRAHPMFADGSGGSRVVAEACFSTNGTTTNSLCPSGANSEVGVGAGIHCVGIGGCDHGTHVAGIAVGGAVTSGGSDLVGVAPGADIIGIQVFTEFTDSGTCNGSPSCVLSYSTDQLAALEWLGGLDISQGGTLDVASANMSLGGGRYYSACSSYIGSGIDALWSIGIPTVIATGNNGYSDSVSSPACNPKAIAVGATTDSDDVANYSNAAADLVDVYAPGSSVLAAIPSGGYGYKSGTSMATPHVAGAWALLRQAGAGDGTGAGVDAALVALQDTGFLVGTRQGGTELGYSHPRIDVTAAIERLNSTDSWLSISVSGQGTVTSDPVGIDCGSDCSMVIGVGDTIELTATPATDWTFSQWIGCDSVAADVCTLNITVEENRSVSAVFVVTPPSNDNLASAITLTDASLTTSVETQGATMETSEPLPSCDGTAGKSIWYQWSVANDGKLREVSVNTIGSDYDTNLDVRQVIAGVDFGSEVDCDYGTSVAGFTDSKVTFMATPNENYYVRISGYEGTGGEAVLNWTVRSSYTLTTSTVGAGEGVITSAAGISCGTSATDCQAEVLIDDTVTLSAVPGSRSMLANWGGACDGTPVTESCTFVMSDDTAVQATFEINPVIFHNRFGEVTTD